MRALVATALLLAACYDPVIAPGTYRCGANGACPSGQLCNAHGCCVNDANDSNTCASVPVGDGGMVGKGDMGGDTTGGCRSGLRAQYDRGWPNVALCAGGWALPGVTKTPECQGAPDDKGTYHGTSCAIADNCAAGWRVCSDGDLAQRGVTRGMCSDLKGGIWLTQTMDSAINPACGANGGDTLVWGCGDAQMYDPKKLCMAATQSMDVRGCSMTAGQPTPYNCTLHIGTTLTKIGGAGGGVMCCKE